MAWSRPRHGTALTKGVGQAKDYCGRMDVRFGFATNGRASILDMESGAEGPADGWPPDELWNRVRDQGIWRIVSRPCRSKTGRQSPRPVLQDIAVNRVTRLLRTESGASC